jgi:hypothetical protein
MSKINKKMTRGKIDHILSWVAALKAKYIWNSRDQEVENFLKGYKKYLCHVNFELSKKNRLNKK